MVIPQMSGLSGRLQGERGTAKRKKRTPWQTRKTVAEMSGLRKNKTRHRTLKTRHRMKNGRRSSCEHGARTGCSASGIWNPDGAEPPRETVGVPSRKTQPG